MARISSRCASKNRKARSRQDRRLCYMMGKKCWAEGGSRRRKIELALRRNILIFHLGALGDFVVTWPLALALGRLHPQSRIFYVAAGQKGKLAEKALRTESTDIESGWHHLFGGDLSAMPEAARKQLENAHSVYSFIAAPGDAWSNTVRALAPETQLVHLAPRPTEPSDFPGHISQWIGDQLKVVP